MKLIITFLLSFTIAATFAQQNKFTGIWEGKINVGVSLRLVFQFSQNEDKTLTAVLRSPDQSPKPLLADTAWISGDSIYTTSKKFGISFSGALTGDSSINGTIVQGVPIPLQLKKVSSVAEAKRPQTPLPPFPYNSKDVEYTNADKSVSFGGTLTWPQVPAGTNYIKAPTYPVALLITGSGAQDRDENIFMHKPFAVIADYLTKRGFAVLRVDDRGVGKSTGNFATATTQDFANDVEAGINYLKTLPQIDTFHIGMIGHSEGGMIAPIVASRRKDIKFIVLLAGPGVPIKQLMSEQIYASSKAEGNSEEVSKLGSKLYLEALTAVQSNTDTAVARQKIVEQLSKSYPENKKLYDSLELNTPGNQNKYASGRIQSLTAPWYKYFSSFDPTPYLQKLSCDVLALNGEKDIQVSAASNLAGIRAALKKSKSKKYDVKQLPGLNHLFQTCKKCSVAEYGELEETFSPEALKIVGDWLEGEK